MGGSSGGPGSTGSTARNSSLLFFAVVSVLLGGAMALAVRSGGDWPALVMHHVARVTGWCALATLVSALTMTPLRRIVRRARPEHSLGRALAPLRRTLGITAAILAMVHAAIALIGPLDGAFEALFTWPYLRAGLGALLILAALLTTSFPTLNRRLRVRLWKPLHRLVYAASALALLHAFTGPFAPRALVASVGVLVAVLFILRVVTPRTRKRGSQR